MTSSFKVTLDTTAPDLSVVGKPTSSGPGVVILTLDLDDAEELRIWGDIDPLGPENGAYAEKEEDALWFPAEEELLVRLVGGNENPELHISARDEVWNVTTLVKTFPIAQPAPPAPPPSPGWPSPERQRPLPADKLLVRTARLRLRTHRSRRRSITRSRSVGLHVRHQRMGGTPLDERLSRGRSIRLSRRGAVHAALGASQALKIGTRHSVRRTGEPEDDTDALIALNLL